MICQICEKPKPIAEMKTGRYCGLVACASCRESGEPNTTETTPEEWSRLELPVY